MRTQGGLWMEQCILYFISLRSKGYPDESFYNEYDFICHERFQKDPIPISSQDCNLQAEVSIS